MKKSTIGKGLLVLGGVAYGAGASADDATVTPVSQDLDAKSGIVSTDPLPDGAALPDGSTLGDDNTGSSSEEETNGNGCCSTATPQDPVPGEGQTSPVNWNPLFSQPDSMTWYFQTEGGEKFPIPTDGLGGNPAGDGMSGQELINHLYQSSADSLGISGPWASLDDSTQALIAGCAYEIGKDMGICVDNTYATNDSTRQRIVARRPTSDSLEAELRRNSQSKGLATVVDTTGEGGDPDGEDDSEEGKKDESGSGDPAGSEDPKESEAMRYFRATSLIYENTGAAVDAFIGNAAARFGIGAGVSYNGVRNAATTTDSSSVRYDNPLGFSEEGSIIDTETGLGNLVVTFPRLSLNVGRVTLTGMLDHYQTEESRSGMAFVRNVVEGIQEGYDDEKIPVTSNSKWNSCLSAGADVRIKGNWGIAGKYSGFNKKGSLGVSYTFGQSRNGNLKAAEAKRAARGN
jgi:hypothetical protein